ncbi:hypothetical protein GCM10023205_73870 [Yinghuangia aomiensis]|uniref:Uncharacterized protein n=1 Tax=Yinghuangia aomiensis TaxID=676205 RepID=A0ABP9I953_9ACTN
MPDTESATAIELMQANAPAVAGASGIVVWQTADSSDVTAPEIRDHMSDVLDSIAHAPGAVAVDSPYTTAGAHQGVCKSNGVTGLV